MFDIKKIDKNFSDGIVSKGEFLSIDSLPFKVYGVKKDEQGYYRMEPETAKKINDGVSALCRHTAGGIIKFKTNSRTVAIKAENAHFTDCSLDSICFIGSSGFDAYCGEYFLASFPPTIPAGDYTCEKWIERDACFRAGKADKDGFIEITVNMPIYGYYKDISIKVEEGCEIRESKGFINEKPVVFYGSSITQGDAASTPGTTYINTISRDLDLYCRNLGFSGSARGEEAMAEYIAGLEMSAFVLDYDYNAPTPEYLENTHKHFFDIVRAKNPTLPIIIISAVHLEYDDNDREKRFNIVYSTYEKAKASGDKNVYFADARTFFNDEIRFDDCTVDGCHPNSFGMFMMAKGIEKVLAPLFE